MEVKPQELVRILRDKIALYEHLGIEVLEISALKVHFKVSLEKNHNHKGTAFGGSLYATAVLAAYALVLAGLKSRGFATEDIVIAKGEMKYLRPVETDFEVICEFKTLLSADHFFAPLKTQGKAKGIIESYIVAEGGSLKASFVGSFVVRL